MPYIPDKTHHMLDLAALSCLKPSCNIINFARGELIDHDALQAMYDNGSFFGNYVRCNIPPRIHDADSIVVMNFFVHCCCLRRCALCSGTPCLSELVAAAARVSLAVISRRRA